MINHTLRRTKTWLPFVLILTVFSHFGLGHSDTSAYVLCFGADGHVAVENADHDHGTHPGNNFQAKDEAGTVLTDGGSPCTDIPVIGDDHGTHVPLLVLSKISVDLGFLPLIFLFILLIPYARITVRRPFISEPLFTDSRLLAHRSTVLLN
ncbi:MAG: hypothetical protein HOO93_01160 [Methyloglobulus sp.]|nr:hypothetical protein [Methyloglobulus sp.]